MTRRDYLDQVEEQLIGATARGPRRDRRRELLAVIPALAAAAAIVVVVLLAVSGHGGHGKPPQKQVAGQGGGHVVHHSRPSSGTATTPRGAANPLHASGTVTSGTVTGASGTTTLTASSRGQIVPQGPVPAGFEPESFTALGEIAWYLLGKAPCSSPPCTSIVATFNGGTSFFGMHAPRTDQVDQLRFANIANGYAFGPQLWTTHDGGSSWKQVELGGTVYQLATSGAYVYALVEPANGASELMRSPVGVDDWQKLESLVGNPFGGVWVQNSDVLVGTENGSSSIQRLSISTNAGDSFTTQNAATPSVVCSYSTMQLPVLWADCATGMQGGLWRSTDGGTHWTGVGGDGIKNPPAGNDLPQIYTEPNSAPFAAASATTAVYGFRQLYRTTDGGAHWAKLPTPPGLDDWQYLGFTDATHGVAIGQFGKQGVGRLYYTTDGGASYHQVPIK
jgi:hypothetical protein